MPTPSSPSKSGASGRPASLAEIVDHEAFGYRQWGTPDGDFLARQMERLAQLVRWTGAESPQQHDDRMEVWEEEVRRQHYDQGFTAGRIRGIEEAKSVIRASYGARN